MDSANSFDRAQALIRANMELAPVPTLSGIHLYTARPATGLGRLTGSSGHRPPYWAYPWAGGAALARYLLDRPAAVAGRGVLDFGAGSGIVGIAAAKAGASEVFAAEIDPFGLAALNLNAAANGVSLTTIAGDLTDSPPPRVDVVLAGDVFYAPDLAERVTTFLDRCVAAGIEVLVGDPGRAHLPLGRLQLLARYDVPDFGTASVSSAVYAFRPPIEGA
jgi:predicted nicotinamide N-methyase